MAVPKNEAPIPEPSVAGWTVLAGTSGGHGGGQSCEGVRQLPPPQLSFLGWVPQAVTLKAQIHDPKHFGVINSVPGTTLAISPTGSHGLFTLSKRGVYTYFTDEEVKAFGAPGDVVLEKSKVVEVECQVLGLVLLPLQAAGTVEGLSSSTLGQALGATTGLDCHLPVLLVCPGRTGMDDSQSLPWEPAERPGPEDEAGSHRLSMKVALDSTGIHPWVSPAQSCRLGS